MNQRGVRSSLVKKSASGADGPRNFIREKGRGVFVAIRKMRAGILVPRTGGGGDMFRAASKEELKRGGRRRLNRRESTGGGGVGGGVVGGGWGGGGVWAIHAC